MKRDGGGDPMAILLGVFALGNLANAAWMLGDPTSWYQRLPGRVPDFGPLNEHLVRDVGTAYFTVSVALLWAALRPAVRAPLVTLVAVLLGSHALLHVFDTLRGYVDARHWWLDAPGVYVPAVVMALIAVRVTRGARAATTAATAT